MFYWEYEGDENHCKSMVNKKIWVQLFLFLFPYFSSVNKEATWWLKLVAKQKTGRKSGEKVAKTYKRRKKKNKWEQNHKLYFNFRYLFCFSFFHAVILFFFFFIKNNSCNFNCCETVFNIYNYRCIINEKKKIFFSNLMQSMVFGQFFEK